MRTRMLAVIAVVVLLIPTTTVAVAAKAPPPPTITPLCVTDKEYLWAVTSDAAGLGDYPNVDFTPRQPGRWSFPDGGQTWLRPLASGGKGNLVYTAKADGTSLYVRWTDHPAKVASTSTAPASSCQTATLAVKRVVDGGTTSPSKFVAEIVRSTFSYTDDSGSEQVSSPVTSDAAQTVQPGTYTVGPTKRGAKLVALPAGYGFRSTLCITTGGWETTGGAVTGETTDLRYQRLVPRLDPASTTVCTITFHFGAVLFDTIGAGRALPGQGQDPWEWAVTVKKGSWITYFVTTSPNLAGKKVQIWTKAGGTAKPWKLTKTVTVAADGTIRYFAKVKAFAGFQARWPGDNTLKAGKSDGRYVKVK